MRHAPAILLPQPPPGAVPPVDPDGQMWLIYMEPVVVYGWLLKFAPDEAGLLAEAASRLRRSSHVLTVLSETGDAGKRLLLAAVYPKKFRFVRAFQGRRLRMIWALWGLEERLCTGLSLDDLHRAVHAGNLVEVEGRLPGRPDRSDAHRTQGTAIPPPTPRLRLEEHHDIGAARDVSGRPPRFVHGAGEGIPVSDETAAGDSAGARE